MATKIYLPSSGAASITPSTWIFANQINPLTFAGRLSPSNSALTTKLEATGTTSPITKAMLRFVVGPLAAQTISGTVRMVMKALESNAGANANLAMAVKIIKPDGSDRATLLGVTSSDAASSPYEIAASLATAFCYTTAEVEPPTLTSQSATAGDYLVIEIGFRSATTTSRNISLRYGDAGGSDFAHTVGLTTDLNPWVEFSATLVFQYSLAVANIAQAQTIDNLSLTQHQLLVVQDVTQVQFIDSLTLTQHSPAAQLEIQNVSQAQNIDNIVLTQHQSLAVQDVSQVQSIDNLTLTQHSVLVVADVAQAQTIEGLVLTQHSPLVVENVEQVQAVDELVLTQHQMLVVSDVAQVQSVDNLTLTTHAPGGFSLEVDDVIQVQNVENLVLVQHYTLVVQDVIQVQFMDAITLTSHPPASGETSPARSFRSQWKQYKQAKQALKMSVLWIVKVLFLSMRSRNNVY